MCGSMGLCLRPPTEIPDTGPSIPLLLQFATFSTFGYESFLLLQNAEYLRLGVNVGFHVMAGIALVWRGYTVTTV